MDYISYKKLKTAFFELTNDIETGFIRNGSGRNYNEIIAFFRNIKNGRINSEYFSKKDFNSPTLPEWEFNAKTDNERASIIQDLHKNISQVYILLAHYENRDVHTNSDDYNLKDNYMENYIIHAILGGKAAHIIYDEDHDNYLLRTHMKLILDNKYQTIDLHFGTRQNCIDNYCRMMDGVFRTLENYLPDNRKDKENFYKVLLKDFVMNIETNSLEKQAHFKPFTKFLSQFPYDTKIISKVFSEICDPDLDKDQKDFLSRLSSNIENLQNSKNGTSLEKDKSIARLIRDCQLTQPRGKKSFDLGELTILLENIGYHVTEEQIKDFIHKKDNLHSKKSDRILLKKYIQQKDNSRELLSILTSTAREKPEQISVLKDIDLFYGENAQISNILNIINEINIANGEEKYKLKKKLVYRCVGLGTEGKNALFSDSSDKSSYEQISEFIRALNIDIPNLDEQINEAIEDKELLKEEGWDIGTEKIAQYGFIEILKNGMIEHNMSLEHVDEAIDYYRQLDILYGRDDDNTIETIARRINKILEGNERRRNRRKR